MTTSDTITAHLDAARALIDATAMDTIRATPRAQRRKLAHIDAAQRLMTAAVELFAAAEDIAKGKPIRGHGAPLGAEASNLAVALRVAERETAEAGRMLDRAAQ